MSIHDAFIDPALRIPHAGPGLQQLLFNFEPVLSEPAPPPLMAPYQIATGGKLNKDSIVCEFVLVEMKIQQLEHNLHVTNNENMALQMLLTCAQAETELRFCQMQKSFEDRLKQFQVAVASRPIEVKHGDSNDSTDSSSSEDEEVDLKKKKLTTEAEEARLSIEVAKHMKILASDKSSGLA
jgi:hypothetical protein